MLNILIVCKEPFLTIASNLHPEPLPPTNFTLGTTLYPTPQNAGKVVYRDNAENCYKYEAKQVKCPKNKEGPQPIVTPIQHVNIEEKKNESVFTTMGKWMK